MPSLRAARNAIVIVCATTIASSLAAATVDSGQRLLGQDVLEAAYDAADGSFAYLLTPAQAPVPRPGEPVSPVYVVVYPTAVASLVGTVNCQHQPMDNCPDHGPAIAGLAEAARPDVYGSGVWGHDHLVTAPPSNDGTFHVARLPIAVLFTSVDAAANHITTLAQLNDAIASGSATTIALPGATFHGASASEAAYVRAVPVRPVAPLP